MDKGRPFGRLIQHMTELTLYHADYSTCSQKVRIALAEKGIEFISKPINFRKEEPE